MEQILAQQVDICEQTNRLFVNFKKSPKERITVSYIETRQDVLSNYYRTFMSQHATVLVSGKVPTTYQELYDNFMEVYLDLCTLFKEKLLTFSTTPASTVVSHDIKSHVAAKLPPIQLPTFAGEYGSWITFRDLFRSLVHDDVSISVVNKCQYLKSSLKGEAESLVKHIPISESNYEVIWNILIKRFDNKRSIVNSYLAKLLGQKRMSSESTRGIKEVLDTTSECLISLKNMDVPTDQWDDIVVHIVISKLDSESHKLFEQTLNDSSILPTWSQLSKFLEHRFRTLEMLKPNQPREPHVPHVPKHPMPSKKVFVGQVDTNSSSTKKCIYCKEDHYICHCKKFCSLDVEIRRKFAQDNMLCFNCLRVGHSAYKCLQSTVCRMCSRKHHSLLHVKPLQHSSETHCSIDNTIQNSQQASNAAQPSKSSLVTNSSPLETPLDTNSTREQAIMTLTQHMHSCPVLLATALVDIHANGEVFTLRALIDQGSQACLVTESACQSLGLKVHAIDGNIGGLNSFTVSAKGFVNLDMGSKYDTKYRITFDAYVLKTLTSCLPTEKYTLNWPELSTLKLADPKFLEPNQIDMILGAEVHACIIKDGILRKKGEPMIAQDSHLGWFVSGLSHQEKRTYNIAQVNHVKVEVDTILRKFWELEDVETHTSTRVLTKEEKRCDDHYNTTYQRNEDGRYNVKLPFVTHPPDLGESRSAAQKRLYAMERKFKSNPKLEEDYKDFMKDYIEKNHMEAVPTCDLKNKRVCYLPHHAVLSPHHLTTKLRVVFDGSSNTTNGKSLNDNLLIGPPLQNDIRNIILRWRRHAIVLVADIRQMYRQIMINKNDVDYQRIVWRWSPEEPVMEYRLLTVTYGTSCAPYLAIKTLKQLVEDEKDNFEEDILDKVTEDFYVDDLLTGCSEKEEAKIIKKEITDLMMKGGFPLHKWTSNWKHLREQAEEGSRKILGIKWEINKDAFILKIDLNEDTNQVPTKRTVLGDIAKIYDPSGWLSPVVVVLKILLQKLWLSKYDWDRKLEGELLESYQRYKCEVMNMPEIELNRWIEQQTKEGGEHKVELHGYSDASTVAYSAVVYYRTVTTNGIKVTMLEAKTKVAPVKQLSLPRLELCGAVLLAKLLGIAQHSLNVPWNNVYAWTDSSIVLAWLQRHPNYWSTFVANRITEIINIVDKQHWYHVKSKDNPADVASRGTSPKELSSHDLWWNGPTWLHAEPLPVNRLSVNEIPETNLESKLNTRATTYVGNVEKKSVIQEFNILTRYSSLTKLVRVVSYCFRFYEKCKRKVRKCNLDNDFNSYLKTKELKHSLEMCIKLSQLDSFKEDIVRLKQNKMLKSDSRIMKLNPYVDKNDVLRVGGRIAQSSLPSNTKHPIILSNDHFAELIVKDAHCKTLHGGIQLMSTYIRTTYWIIRVKNLIKKCIHNCLSCYRQTAKPADQLMGDLPKVRVTPNRPFLISGVDFAGPVTLKLSKGRNVKTQKAYIALFVCTAVKAIHLELVTSLDTEGFIAAFRRFTARRGHCKLLLSDCGTNFVGAAKQLQFMEEQSKIDLPENIVEILANNGTEWSFNPASAPHMGGLWEAGVKSTKNHLKRVLGDVKLTYEEYVTLLCQIEACLNSRPLTVDASLDDPSEPQALTPGHFLIGENPIVVPDENIEVNKVTYNTRWIYLQQKLQEFWRRWHSEYLTDLQRRYKWKTVKENIKIGDIVLVKEDRIPPTKWCLAKVLDVHPGSDGQIRVVTLRHKSTIIKRPIHKLCVLPLQE